MSRRKRHAEHANHERWLVSYADFITLLFAFFVVMFASSQVDQRKVGKLALAVQVAFQQLGVFQASAKNVPFTQDGNLPFQENQLLEQMDRTDSMQHVTARPKGVTSGPSSIDKGISEVRKELAQSLGPEIERGKVTLQLKREGLVISLKEIGFFDSGSADLRPDAVPLIGRINAALAPRPYQLHIEGHTDNVPIHTTRFASNWELSTARAITIVQMLVKQYGMTPARLSAGGFGEFHPVATNATSEGRQANRRVDIVVIAPPRGTQQLAKLFDSQPLQLTKPQVINPLPKPTVMQ